MQKYKINDKVEFIYYDLITKKNHNVIGIIINVESEPYGNLGYQYSIYIPDYETSIDVFEFDIIKKININTYLDKLLDAGHYELAIENVCIDLVMLKKNLQNKLTEYNSEIINDVIKVINEINYSVRIKHNIGEKIIEKHSIKTNNQELK